MVVCIPPELTDYIIDFLHDNRVALKACSLTSRAWYPTARYHLYQNVSLSTSKSWQTYHDLLMTSPALGSYTRRIGISHASPYVGQDKADDARRELEHLWASILPALTTIEHLELSCLTIRPALVPNLAQNLATVTNISLQYCRFESFSDFAMVFCSFPLLRTCVIRGITLLNAVTHASATSSGTIALCPRLTALTLGRDLPLEDLVQWFLSQDACKDLLQFSGSCSSERDVMLLSELLKSASNTLRSVELDWYSASFHDVHLPFDFSIGPCPNLQSLSLRCPIALRSTVPWVTSLLDRINPARLKTFNLEVRLLGSLDGFPWSNLESRLLQEEFTELASVHVKILVWHTATGIPDGATRAIPRLMPILHEKGMLQTHC